MASKTYLFSIENEEKTNTETVSEMDYKTLDGSCWRAEYCEGKFIHSPNGDQKRSHEDIYLAFLEPGGAKWHMTIEDGKFALRKERGGQIVSKTDTCHITGWDGKGRWVTLSDPGDMSGVQDMLQGIMKDLKK